MPVARYDVLIIGSGIAGLCAALEAKGRVAVATQMKPTQVLSSMAQGGINAAIGKGDSPEKHAEDTLKAGVGLADENAVRTLCENAPEAISWLEKMGAPFSRDDHGKPAIRRMGGHSLPRTIYAQDYTGLKILHTLYDQALKKGVVFLSDRQLVSVFSGGAVLAHQGQIEAIGAGAVILATGGYAGLYAQGGTNGAFSTGEALIAAANAGCELERLHFVQFHPTALKSGHLISEAARGAGGILIDQKGERFTDELGPRDAVSRAVYERVSRGEPVFLDLRALGEGAIEKLLPQERKLAKLHAGVDLAHEIVPVQPAAHYSMGGIRVDTNGFTGAAGIFACGECASTRVHGANRLGGNSLLEAVVFGRIAGQKARGEAADDKTLAEEAQKANFKQTPLATRRETARILTQYAGVVRDEAGLKTALDRARALQGAELAVRLIESALNDQTSCGAHCRKDYP